MLPIYPLIDILYSKNRAPNVLAKEYEKRVFPFPGAPDNMILRILSVFSAGVIGLQISLAHGF